MAKNENNSGKGLDVGTSFVRSCERQAQEVTVHAERNAFIDVNQQDFTEVMLSRAQVDYVKTDDQLYLVGNKAMELANVSNRELRRPLSRGLISPSEKEALPMIETIIKGVVGPAKQPGQILYYSVPGIPIDAEANLSFHERTVQILLRKMGYDPKPINEGLTVIFAELADSRFTGIGISFGGGLVNVCFSFRSVPVTTFSVSRAGDWIDENAALAVGEKAGVVCSVKESTLDLTKTEGVSKIESALAICYDNLIRYVLDNLRKEISKTVRVPHLPEPIPIVIGGGTASLNGFAERFAQALQESRFPLEIEGVRMAREPFNCVAVGALVAAEAEA